jgi:hypothetical protein
LFFGLACRQIDDSFRKLIGIAWALLRHVQMVGAAEVKVNGSKIQTEPAPIISSTTTVSM